MKRIFLVLILLLAGSEVSTAATFLFTLKNRTVSDIASVRVRGGEIEQPTSIRSGADRELKVTLPDGKCRAELRVDFATPNFRDDDKVIDFCKYIGITVG